MGVVLDSCVWASNSSNLATSDELTYEYNRPWAIVFIICREIG
jgi:hypothetical protein